MSNSLNRLVHNRLGTDGVGDQDWSRLVLAAFDGIAGIEEVLRTGALAATTSDNDTDYAHGGAYLKTLTVEGFRGIGPEKTLTFEPGPGLTVVVGRNGSGKSSFAEALEVLFTGNSQRWVGRSKVWQEGWRNLHHAHPAKIAASVSLDGERETSIARQWDESAAFDAHTTAAQTMGKPKTTLDALGWNAALVSYRPFLSYNELGSLLDEGPSKLYDALSLVLGLDELVQAQAALGKCRTERQHGLKAADQERKAIIETLKTLLSRQADARAQTCLDALTSDSWGLAEVESVLATASAPAADQDLTLLSKAATLDAPDSARVASAVQALREADEALKAVAGTDAERSRELADLLDAALEFHGSHGSDGSDGSDKNVDCPVCGQRSALTQTWAESSRRESARFREAAASSEAAHNAADRALRQARQLLTAPPAFLAQLATSASADLDGLQATRDQWIAWSAGASLNDMTEVAKHLETGRDALSQATDALKQAAAAELQRREDLWRPVAVTLTAWLPRALEARAAVDDIPLIKLAEAWLKEASVAMRNDRFAPIADKAMAAWAHLRQQSNVELGRIELSGASTSRRVVLDVTVDDVPGAALGVMSQGELHSLALSLFLPRATLDESPFRFVVIDDPVQSMDPARVDGLARALEETARTRQVIVFTHDDRLPEALRRLAIKSTILGITRRPQSVVEVRQVMSPVRAHIEDALALVKTTELPDAIKRQVIPGFCRSAIEAACISVIRRKRLGAGKTHVEVEAAIEECRSTTTLASLALFDDSERGGDVMARLNRTDRFGSWAGDVFKQCKEGAHTAAEGDLELMLRDAKRLALALLELR